MVQKPLETTADWLGSETLTASAKAAPKREPRSSVKIDRSQPALQVTDAMICQIQHDYLREGILAIVLRQFYYENLTRFRTRVSFRMRQNTDAVNAYCAMNMKEFEGINARQRWANWRSVPRSLNGHLPNRSLRVVDLCCGVGQSTEMLAFYLAPGSEILGLEYNPDFVKLARTREYPDETGAPAHVTFNAQSVLETFKDADGKDVKSGSVDLVNCCGAVAHHFDPAATEELAAEVTRVLRKGGLATIDSGEAGTSRDEVISIFSRHGFDLLSTSKSCMADRSTQICLRKRQA